MNKIGRVQQLIQKRGQVILADFQRRTGITTCGEIYLTSAPAGRYARVNKDPDVILNSPDSDYPGGKPDYTIWVGAEEKDASRVMRSFHFALAHEAAEVIADNCLYSCVPVFKLPANLVMPADDLGRSRLAELQLDRLAVDFYSEPKKRQNMIWSMVGFSRLVIEDYLEGGLPRLTLPAAAREMAKLLWAANDPELPAGLRREAGETAWRYAFTLVQKVAGWEEKKNGYLDLLNTYSDVFTNLKIPLLLSLAERSTELLKLGSGHYQNGEYETALGYLQKAVDLEPANLPARVGLGNALTALGQFSDAFTELCRVFPRYREFWNSNEPAELGVLSQAEFREYFISIGLMAATLKMVEKADQEGEAILRRLYKMTNSVHRLADNEQLLYSTAALSASAFVVSYFEMIDQPKAMINVLQQILKLADHVQGAKMVRKAALLGMTRAYQLMGDLKGAGSVLDTLSGEYPNDPELAALRAELRQEKKRRTIQ